MRHISPESIDKYTKRFELYMKKYGLLYEEQEREFIKANFLNSYFAEGIDIDIMNQVYETIGLFDNYPNLYKANLKYLMECYDINTDILEVGGGYVPAFAKKMNDKQKSGSVSVMDPSLIVSSYGNLKLYRENFTEMTDVSKFKLLVGIQPCDATLPMIKSANKNDLDMYMMLCGCTHFEDVDRYSYITYGMWVNYLEEVMKDTLPANRTYSFNDVDGVPYYVLRTFKK